MKKSFTNKNVRSVMSLLVLALFLAFGSSAHAIPTGNGISANSAEDLVNTAFSRAKYENDLKFKYLSLNLKQALQSTGVPVKALEGSFARWTNLTENSDETRIVRMGQKGNYNVVDIESVFNIYTNKSTEYTKIGATIQMNFRAVISVSNPELTETTVGSFKILKLVGTSY